MNTENISDIPKSASNDSKPRLNHSKTESAQQMAGSINSNERSVSQLRLFWFWILAYGATISYGIYHFNKANSATFSIVILVCLIFVHIYTESIELTPLEGANPGKKREFEENRRLQRQRWMIFAYGFMLFSLIMTLYPFVVPYGDNASKKDYLDTIRERPVALFIGYSVDGKDKKPSSSIESSKEVSDSLALSASVDKQDGQANDPEAPENITVNKTKPEWVINIGGYVEACEPGLNANNGTAVVCAVNGGLQVPLYFIILALMGGSISLTRRLPELQKMASSAYVATENQPKLSQHEFREYLIFHIVQFISAPFLAILAYYLVEPSNTANSVALAFIAGFASESILLMIRSVAEKISPRTTDTAQYGTITGVVTLVQIDKTMKPATTAEVSLVDLPHVTTLTDEQGLYVLGNVPVGMNNIRVVSAGAKEKADSVKIEHSQAVVRKNVTIEA
jgi:hypothetical protein